MARGPGLATTVQGMSTSADELEAEIAALEAPALRDALRADRLRKKLAVLHATKPFTPQSRPHVMHTALRPNYIDRAGLGLT